MCATAQATLYLAREKPLATWSADGTFQLQMLAFDAIDSYRREAWRLLWTGQAAFDWWANTGQHLQPGAALRVQATRIRPHMAARGPEIHATVTSLDVAPSGSNHTPPQAAPAFSTPRPAVAH